MLRILSIFSVIFFVVAAPRNGPGKTNLDLPINAITANGYVGETHHVTTEDGYILTMHRIPYKRGETSAPADRPVAFFMHGLYGVSYYYFMNQKYSIGNHLADAGFDVWFGNARGNTFSRAHVSLDLDDPVQHAKYYDFSWEEIGIYDLPAMIDYILDYTGQEKLHYLGHSQGGTVFLVMGSMRPEYNEKMGTVHLLAGVGYMTHFPDQDLADLASMTDFIYALALSNGLSEVNADVFAALEEWANGGQNYTRADLCFGDIKYKYMCDLIGASHYMRNDGIPEEAAGLGGGAIKQIAHYGQNIRDDAFRRYHYGETQNQQLYGSAVPPIYDISLITSNVTMHYSISDALLDPRDVLAMEAVMPNTVARKVARESFSHEDFAGAHDAKELVNDYIIEVINYEHNRIKDEDKEDGQDTDEEAIEENPTPSPEVTTGTAHGATLSMIFNLYLIICLICYLL